MPSVSSALSLAHAAPHDTTSEVNDEIFSLRPVMYGTITQGLYAPRVKVFLRAGMEGEKKYSPPLDTTHWWASGGKLSGVTGFLGSVPVITGFASSV